MFGLRTARKSTHTRPQTWGHGRVVGDDQPVQDRAWLVLRRALAGRSRLTKWWLAQLVSIGYILRSGGVFMAVSPCDFALCRGEGRWKCSTCRGTGKLKDPRKSEISACYGCKGHGNRVCRICLGSGVLLAGRALLDSTTLVLAAHLLHTKALSPHALFSLLLLIQAIVLAERIVLVEPKDADAREALKTAIEVLQIPEALLERRTIDYRNDINWDHVHASALVSDGSHRNLKTLDPSMATKVDPRGVLLSDLRQVITADEFQPALEVISESDPLIGREWLDDWAAVDSPFLLRLDAAFKGDHLKAIEVSRSILYFRCMLVLRVPYWANYFRVPLFEAAFARINRSFKSVAQAIASEADRQEGRARQSLERLIRQPESLRLDVPLVAAAVMEEASSSGDVIRVALEHRDTRDVVRFRRLCAEAEVASASGGQLAKARDGIVEACGALSDSFGNKELLLGLATIPSASYSFAEGFSGGIGLTDLVTKTPGWISGLLRKRRWAFIHRLGKDAKSIRSLDHLTKKIFGGCLSPAQRRALVGVTGQDTT